jgi:hypothetical protein
MDEHTKFKIGFGATLSERILGYRKSLFRILQ